MQATKNRRKALKGNWYLLEKRNMTVVANRSGYGETLNFEIVADQK